MGRYTKKLDKLKQAIDEVSRERARRLLDLNPQDPDAASHERRSRGRLGLGTGGDLVASAIEKVKLHGINRDFDIIDLAGKLYDNKMNLVGIRDALTRVVAVAHPDTATSIVLALWPHIRDALSRRGR